MVSGPVMMGDGGQLNAPRAYIVIDRDELVLMADKCMLNQTDAELLTGVRLATAGDACRVC